MEIINGVSRTGMSIREFLTAAKEAGVDSLPGTAAEILDDDVRWVLTKGKLPAAQWIEVITTAHQVGIPTTSTMMYGHVDNPAHWVAHLRVLARIQDETGGFTEFVPLPFVHSNAPVYLAGIARPGPTLRDNRAVHAMARIMLHGRIKNIQTHGSSSARTTPGSCSPAASTTWAARSWRRPSPGWPAANTARRRASPNSRRSAPRWPPDPAALDAVRRGAARANPGRPRGRLPGLLRTMLPLA